MASSTPAPALRTSAATDRLAGACGLAAVGWATALPLLGVPRRTDYRHERRAGGYDGPGRMLRVIGFLPTGVLACAFAELGSRCFDDRSAAAGLRCFNGVGAGYITAAFAPGNPGGPTDGTMRQAVHNGAGLFEYLSGAAGLVLFGLGARHDPATRALARASVAATAPYTIVLAATGATAQPETRRRFQRLLEGMLFAWIAATGSVLLFRRHPRSPA